MNMQKKAIWCLSLLTGAVACMSLLGGSAAWADWGHRGYYPGGGGFRRAAYNPGFFGGGYRPHYGYGGWNRPGWNRAGWGNRGWGVRPGGWNRAGWGNPGWGNRGWGGHHGRRW